MLFGRPAEDFLKSLGFIFSLNNKRAAVVPSGYTIDQLITNRHHRLKCRENMSPEQYGLLFEKTVEQLLLSSFKFDVLRGVQFHDEGAGGDYDILAFQSPYLHYIECKTTNNIKFKEIFIRHKFLCPSLTLILIDRPKKDVAGVVYGEVEKELTRKAKEKDNNLAQRKDYKYPIELISDPKASFALYHTYRNIFIASGEDLDTVMRKALRYFHQIVLQSSYL